MRKLEICKSIGTRESVSSDVEKGAEVIARTALYLLQKVPRHQEKILKAGKCYMGMGMDTDLGNYLLKELPSVSTRILEETLVKTMCNHMEDKKTIWNSMDSQTTNCG